MNSIMFVVVVWLLLYCCKWCCLLLLNICCYEFVSLFYVFLFFFFLILHCSLCLFACNRSLPISLCLSCCAAFNLWYAPWSECKTHDTYLAFENGKLKGKSESGSQAAAKPAKQREPDGNWLTALQMWTRELLCARDGGEIMRPQTDHEKMFASPNRCRWNREGKEAKRRTSESNRQTWIGGVSCGVFFSLSLCVSCDFFLSSLYYLLDKYNCQFGT